MTLLNILKRVALLTTVVSSLASAQYYELVSGNATATASSTESYLYEASNVLDGDQGTRWASEFFNNQELVIDFGGTVDIQKVVLKWEAAHASNYELQFSYNGYDWSTPSAYVDANANGGVDEIVSDFGYYSYMKIVLIDRATAYGFSLFEVEVYKEIGAPHISAESIRFESYDNTNGGRPLPECNEERVGQMMAARTGHYSHQDYVVVCLGASTPVTAMHYEWINIASGVSE
ncbi:MAG: discoidin domain-containing protein [Fibrobacterales bacterium]